jgi:hypothetical protein
MDRTAINILSTEYEVLRRKITKLQAVERHAFTDHDAEELTDLHAKASKVAMDIAAKFPIADEFDNEFNTWKSRYDHHETALAGGEP